MSNSFSESNSAQILEKIYAIRNKPVGTSARLLRSEILFLINTAQALFLSQPVLLHLSSPLIICGDIHGQLHDLIRIFDIAPPPPKNSFLFLGDFVDRGLNSIETISILLFYKINFPDRFHMIRGNHESLPVNRLYGFYEECIKL